MLPTPIFKVHIINPKADIAKEEITNLDSEKINQIQFALNTNIEHSSFHESKRILTSCSDCLTPNFEQSKSCFEKKRNWSKEEIALLNEAVLERLNQVSPGPMTQEDWIAIAAKFPTRSFLQCKTRWTAFNVPKKHKSFWNAKEDTALKDLVHLHGEKSWAIIAKALTQMNIGDERIGKQCRERWYNRVSPSVALPNDSNEWTAEEDSTLRQLILKHGTKWKTLAKSFPGRSETSVKNRFYNLKKKNLVAAEEARKARFYTLANSSTGEQSKMSSWDNDFEEMKNEKGQQNLNKEDDESFPNFDFRDSDMRIEMLDPLKNEEVQTLRVPHGLRTFEIEQ